MKAYHVDINGNITRRGDKKKKKLGNADYVVNEKGQVFTVTQEEEDIAPVKSTTAVSEGKQKDSYLQKGALSDGFSLKNLNKAKKATETDFKEDVTKGILGLGERIWDGLVTLAPTMARANYYQNGGGYNVEADKIFEDSIKKSEKDISAYVAKDLIKEEEIARKLITEPFQTKTGINVEESSVIGSKGDALVQSASDMLVRQGLNLVVPGAGLAITGVSSFGGEAENAFNNGAKYEEAVLSGLISAGAEVGTEKIAGIKFGGKTLTEGVTKSIAKKVPSKVLGTLTKWGFNTVGEGAEEVIAGKMTAIGQHLTYQSEKEIDELFSNEDAWESFMAGAILGGVFEGASVASSNLNGTDYVTEREKNEQKVIDTVYKEMVAEQETDGKKLTQSEKNKIYKSVENSVEKGYIDIETIEKTLGGDTYKAYKDTVDSEDAILKEYEELGNTSHPTLAQTTRYNELTEQVKGIKEGTKRTQLKEQLSNEVFSIAHKSRLAESYNEKARKGQVFEADLAKYDAKQQEVVKKAIDSGILNNTNRTHEFVDMVAKISADKGVLFDFANNEKLKESGFAIGDKTINGFVKDGNVTLNIDSAKSLNSVVGHEITHVLEGTELYGELQNIVTEFAKTKGEYDTRYQELAKLYEGVEGANVDAELVADLVGDYLFTDSDFVNRLSAEKPNIFQKIFDEIKYLCKVATAGSKEARELEKVKKAFEKAYKDNANSKSDVKYSVSDSNIEDVSTGYGHGEHYYTMSYKQDGKVVATLEYGVYDETPNVKMIEVDKEYRRKGIATKLMQELQNKYSGKEIEFGMSTPDGSKLLESITYDVTDEKVAADSQKLKDLQSELDELQEKLDVLYDAETLTEEQEAELQKLGDRWEVVYDSIRELEQSLNGKKAKKTFVKTNAKYSLADTDGKQLTKEQQEFFKDSKVRDENGNLKVMYHGTERGAGFTVFDNEFSDDGRSFFFTDSNVVAKGYSGTYSTYAPKAFSSVDEVNEEIHKGVYNSEYHVEEENGEYVLYYEDDEMETSDSLDEIYRVFEEGYGRGMNSANYKVYLNLKNPLIVDAEGRNWDELPLTKKTGIDRYNYIYVNGGTDGTYNVEWEDMLNKYGDAESAEMSLDDIRSKFGVYVADDVVKGRQDFESINVDNRTKELIPRTTRQFSYYAKKNGYDGVIFKNIYDNAIYASGSEKFEKSTVVIAFDSNQIKSVANQKPTKDADIRYSLSEDNKGNKLSEGQKEYFKDSKIVDPKGYLKVMYHGTPNEFTVFNPMLQGGKNGTAEGYGIYFTDSEEVAKSYGDKRMSGYLNVTHPARADRKTIKKGELVKLLKATTEVEAKQYVDDGDYDNVKDALRDTWISNYVDTYSSTMSEAYKECADSILSMNDNDMSVIQEVMGGMAVRDYESAYKFYDVLKNTIGIDGYITEWNSDLLPEGKAQIVVAFDSNQFKNLDNANPTEDADIRHSLSEKRKGAAQYGNYNVYGKDIRFDAPTTETETQIPVNGTQEETQIAPTNEEDAKQFFSVSEQTEEVAPPIEVDDENERITGEDLTRKNADRIRTIQSEIKGHQLTRDVTKKEFDEKIARKEAEYESLTRKDTKKAVDLRNQITNLEKKRDSLLQLLERKIERANNRIENIEKESRYEKRKTKQNQYRELFGRLMGDTSTWKDKKMGIYYQTNTLHRNLRDVVRDADGNRDIARADAIYDELQGSVNRNEAKKNREANAVKSVFREMKINNAESTYIQMLGELRHNPDTTMTQEIVDEFYKKNKGKIDAKKVDKAIDEARKLYDSLYDRVNAALSEHGFKEMGYRKGYFPHFTDPKQNWLAKLLNWKVNNDEIPTDIAGLTELFEPQRTWQTFDKHRTSDTTDYNFLKGLDNYVNGALDWIYHIEDIQKNRAFETEIRYRHSSEQVQKKIDEYRNNPMLSAEEVESLIQNVLREAKNPLNNFVTDLHTRTNILAGKKSSKDRNMESDFNRHAYSIMTNVTNRVTANQVVGSISSAMTNFIPITQSWGQVNPSSSLVGMRKTIQSYMSDDGMIAKSDFLTNRLAQNEALYKDAWDKIGEKVGGLMEIVDNFTSQTVWRSKYYENIKAGMTEAQAIKDADQFAENVIAGRSKGNQPTIFHAKNPVTKMLTAFQLEVSNQYGYMFKDMPQEIGKEAIGKLAKGYATMFVGAYAYNALYSSLTGRDAAFDPIGIIEDFIKDLGGDDDEEDKVANAIGGLASNVAEEIPFVGGLLGGGRIPISSALPYNASISDAYADIVDGDWKSVLDEMSKPLYYGVLPMGGGQIRKTVQGLAMFDDEHPVSGSYTKSGNLRFPVEDTIAKRFQAALFGQYASSNAREYFDRGEAPLKEKQIQEYADLEMPIRDYWDYRKGLKKQEKLEDKFEYIADLDVSTEQKNIMINNVVDRKEKVDMSNYDDFANFEEFDFYTKNTEKYNFLQENGISYSEYKSDEKQKEKYDDIYSWYKNYPEKVTVSKAVTSNVIEYKRYTSDLNDIRADKDANGKTINGSAKAKKIDYINGLDLDYGQKIILYRSQFNSESDKTAYNADIVEYLNSRNDLSYDEIVTILKELDFKVYADGTVEW